MRKNNLLSLLLALVIAVILWSYVVTTITPEDSQTIYSIPVTFTNEDGLFSDRNLVLSEGRDTTIDLKLYGKRSDLLKLDNTNITITVDLSQVTGTGDWHLRYDIEYPETVASSDISVESRSSYYVNIVVDKLASKTVEVQAIFNGDVAEGYVADSIELEYDTIEVSGPKDLVDTVSYAQVILERTNVSSTISENLSFTLLDEEGNEIDADELTCTVNNQSVEKLSVLMSVYMVKEVALQVELISGGGATSDYAVVDISPSRVTIQGDPEVLETMNSITLGTIDLSSIQTSLTKEFNVVVSNGLVNQTSDVATVTVTLYNLKTKTFQVSNIEYTGFSSDDLKVQLNTVSLQVQVRGPTESINSLLASNIRAVADLSGITGTGQYSVTADIYFDSTSDVGAMGSYTVLVTISEQTTNTDPVEITTGVIDSTPDSSVTDSDTDGEDE